MPRRWEKSSSLKEGDIFKTLYGREFAIGKYRQEENKYECIFKDRVRLVNKRDIGSGRILHPYDRTVYSVGYLGEGLYSPLKDKTPYRKWCGMFKRVYSEDPHYRKNYENVTISEDWHNFQNFADWYYKQDYVMKDIKYELDKDLYYLDKTAKVKHYSKETCTLLPKELNTKIAKFTKNPAVTKEGGKYRARVSMKNVSVELGRFINKINAKCAIITANIALIEGSLKSYKIPVTINYEDIISVCCEEIGSEI